LVWRQQQPSWDVRRLVFLDETGLNPIEMAFAKLKAHLRQAAQRSFDGLIAALAPALALPSFSSSHCLNFFKQACYATD